MSVAQSDSHGSRPVTGKCGGKPPFKLCFSKHQQTGKADACISKSNANFITPKFYSRDTDCVKDANVSDTVEEIAKEEDKNPKQKYRWPLLTSHTYGWWHDKGIQPKDPRFNYHKKTSDMVSFQMKIYAEDRKLKGLNY